jgi:hypothetical protein
MNVLTHLNCIAPLVRFASTVTPMQSISDQLLYERARNIRKLHRLKFVWIERDPVLVKNAEFVHGSKEKNAKNKKTEITDKNTKGTDYTFRRTKGNMTEQLLSTFDPDLTADKELDELYTDSGMDQRTVLGYTTKATKEGQSSLKPKPDEKPIGEVLDLQIYLTGKSMNKPSLPSFAKLGRPDIKDLFYDMRKEAIIDGDSKVAVCVSAPHKIMTLVYQACILFSDEKVRFDFHSEPIES